TRLALASAAGGPLGKFADESIAEVTGRVSGFARRTGFAGFVSPTIFSPNRIKDSPTSLRKLNTAAASRTPITAATIPTAAARLSRGEEPFCTSFAVASSFGLFLSAAFDCAAASSRSLGAAACSIRSEERRVGTEGRSQRASVY